MKTRKYILIMCTLCTMLCTACTNEFEYTIPEKYPTKPGEAAKGYSVTLESLLDEMMSYEESAKFPNTVYTSHQESSYDRRSVTPGNPDWFANDDGWGFIRTESNEGREEKVIMEATGPGAITRIWLTSLTNNEAIIRFYFNESTAPDWTLPTYDVQTFTNQMSETGNSITLGNGFVQPGLSWNRGSSLFLPIPFGSGCKITIEETGTAPNPSRYYQINYRKYEEETRVETFTAKALANAKSKIMEANARLLNPRAKVSGKILNTEKNLASTDKVELELTSGSNAVYELKLEVTPENKDNYAEIMENLILTATFDEVQTVVTPLSDLYGAGPGANYVQNWYTSADGYGNVTIRWIMPYKSSGKLAIRNRSAHNTNVKISARVGSFSWDNRTLYFHAASKSEKDVKIIFWSDYSNGYDWNFATITGGRGVLKSDMFSINNHTTNWYGEGDEKIWVDNESFPSHFGTGIEDYYSYCGYFRYNYPFGGEPRLDNGNFNGYNNHYRMRNLDGIPFNNKLKFDLEMEGHEAGTGDIQNMIIWYGDLNTKAEGMDQFTD